MTKAIALHMLIILAAACGGAPEEDAALSSSQPSAYTPMGAPGAYVPTPPAYTAMTTPIPNVPTPPAYTANAASPVPGISPGECEAQEQNLASWRRGRKLLSDAVALCWNQAAYAQGFCPYPNAANVGAAGDNCRQWRDKVAECERKAKELEEREKTEPMVDPLCQQYRVPVPVPVPVPETEPIALPSVDPTTCVIVAGVCVCVAAVLLAVPTGGASLCAAPAH